MTATTRKISRTVNSTVGKAKQKLGRKMKARGSTMEVRGVVQRTKAESENLLDGVKGKLREGMRTAGKELEKFGKRVQKTG